MRVLAVDPGTRQSAYVLTNDNRPAAFDKLDNCQMLDTLPVVVDQSTTVAIEMVASYGMAVGADVFETCVWIGRFMEVIRLVTGDVPTLVYRRDIKLHHCGSAKAKDPNIVQALIDRFAPEVPNRGKGTVKQPGWFHGFKADIWQAYALAVYIADNEAT